MRKAVSRAEYDIFSPLSLLYRKSEERFASSPSSINTPFLWQWVRYLPVPSGQPHSSRHLHYGGIRISQSGIPVEDYSTTPQQNEHGQVQVLVLVGTRVIKTTAKGNSVCAVLYCSCSCAERKGLGRGWAVVLLQSVQCACCTVHPTPVACL